MIPPPLRQQKEFASGASALKRLMRTRSILQGEGFADPDFQAPVRYPSQNFPSPLQKSLPGGDVMEKTGSREKERALVVQNLGIESFDWSAGLPEKDQVASGPKTIHALFRHDSARDSLSGGSRPA